MVAVWTREKGVLLVEKETVEAGVRTWEVVRVVGARGGGIERQRQHGWRAIVSVMDNLESSDGLMHVTAYFKRGRDAGSACGSLPLC